jgi:hypothetical protein
MFFIRRPWTEEEDQILRDNPELPDRVLADKLNRTAEAVEVRKRRLYKPRAPRKDFGWEFDTRPDGWYVEIIGVLLVECPDAFESWLHYHSYKEVKQLGPERCSEVTLLCRRESK